MGLLLLLTASFALGAPRLAPGEERFVEFHVDPGWDGFHNRMVPEDVPRTRQDFGYQPSVNGAERRRGRIGGRVQRSTTPAHYAMSLEPVSLDRPLQASGVLRVHSAEGSSGVLFGWFHHTSRGWRTPNSLVIRLDGNGGKFWVFFEYGTRNWKTGGGHTFEGERYQTTPTKPFPADGTPHRWRLSYDPHGADGKGVISLEFDDIQRSIVLPPEHRADGATFDRFGLLNVQTTGSALDLTLEDLERDGKPIDLAADPKWEGMGNRIEFADRVRRPWQDFGFSPTNRAGGKPGELGGIVWRDEHPAFYADRVGPLSLERELKASGRLVFDGAGSDSGVYFGWFDRSRKVSKDSPEHVTPPSDFLGVVLGGPSRVGHYLRPVYWTSRGEGGAPETGPVLRPDGEPHTWELRYRPDAASGRGAIEWTLDGAKQVFELKPGHRQSGARFDRFGFFNLQSGGHYVSIFVDDLRYTAR